MYAAAPSCFAAVCGWTIMELRLENGQFTQTCICDIMIGKQYPVCFRRSQETGKTQRQTALKTREFRECMKEVRSSDTGTEEH